MRRTVVSLSIPTAVFLAASLPTNANAATGGPDAAGYVFADQDDGAVYNYVDITGTGTLVVNADDGNSAVALGAPFTIYGQVITDIAVSSNGFITDVLSTATDFDNDCPLPDAPSSGAGFFRIAGLHDDLVTTTAIGGGTYYQYFDAAQAAAIGFPGTTDGVSIVQWTGEHFTSDTPVDAEVVLFHDDGTILSMVAVDGDGGEFATMGIQNADASTGLNYVCNTAASVIPGTTAVEYTFEPEVRINEVRMDDPGADNNEYFELFGPPGTPLDGLTYVVIGDEGTTPGAIENVTNRSGVIPAAGVYVVATGSFSLGTADATAFLTFENNDTVTHMLVTGFTGTIGTNVDADADGVIDNTPWTTVLDTVAVIEDGSEFSYGPPTCVDGPTCQEVPDPGAGAAEYIYRCLDGDGIWQVGTFDDTMSEDTPGAANECGVCGDGIAEFLEECDGDGMGMGGETATCDDDCTAVACGDGNINMSAGETCEEGGVESATCDDDCTDVMCGDGNVNMTAGEACDGDGMGIGGETADCNDDCTVAMCGDMVVNMTAGEDCDEGGVETAECNADCTAAVCGDGIVNTTAGEECDGDGMGMGGETAMCDSDCTAPMCGDGIVNMTAGEMCDDMGESEDCDDDCTDVMCGDGVANTTAGEDCDDMGESETCDDDCTPAECGDGVLNTTAGEECDDGNTDDGDECSSECTEPVMGTSTGDDDDDDDDSTGTTGGDDDDDDDTGLDDTAGSDDSSSGGAMTTMPMTTAGMTTMPGGDETGDETGDEGGAVPGEDGCSCTTDGSNDRNAGWMIFGLLGLGAMRRRRRS